MPLPPPMPNELTTSAFPSPVVSRNSRTPPRGPPTATSRSPFSRTTIWREGPIDSATTRAQKPGGSVSPALSGAHTGFLTCGVDAATSAARPVSSSRRVMGTEYSFPAHPTEVSRAVASYVPRRLAGCSAAILSSRRTQAGSGERHRHSGAIHAADGGSDLQLRRAGIPGDGDVAVSGGPAPQERLHRTRRDRWNSDGVGRHVGIGEARHLP